MLEHYLISITAGAASRNLAVLADVKSELGITDSSQDTKLGRLIAAVGSAVAGPEGMRRPPWRQTYVERCNGTGGSLLHLHRWPVESVTSVTYGTTSPATVTASDYSIALEHRSALYNANAWERSSWSSPTPFVGGELYDYAVTYVAGWLMPDQIADWAASTAKTAGAWVRSTNDATLLRFECTTAGTTAGTEPTWPTTIGGTVTDGTVVWTAREAAELPDDLREAATYGAAELYRGAWALPTGIQVEQHEDHRIEYDFASLRAGAYSLPSVLRRVARSYR